MMLTVVADSLNELLGGTFSRVMISEEKEGAVESKKMKFFRLEGEPLNPIKNSAINYENDIHVFKDEDIPLTYAII